MIEIVEYGANIHIARQSTPTMAPVMRENETKARLPDGSAMELIHIATLQLPGLSKLCKIDTHFTNNADSPINIIVSFM